MIIIILFFPLFIYPSVCDSININYNFSNSSAIESDYFDEYYIEKRENTYFIYATHISDVKFSELVEIIGNFQEYPDFMPGYDSIKVLAFFPPRLTCAIP